MPEIIDLVGRKYGKLTVLEYSHRGPPPKRRAYWRCICECGREIITLGESLNSNKTSSCGICIKIGNRRHYTGTKDVCGAYWHYLKRNAKNRKINFELESINQIQKLLEKQNYICTLTGWKLHGSRQSCNMNCSLDRIDSKESYNIDNVQWVFQDVNYMKGPLPQEKFLYYCKLINEFAGTVDTKNIIITDEELNNIKNITISDYYLSTTRNGAIKRDLEFDITKQYLQILLEKQNYQCALTGLDINTSLQTCKKHPDYKEQTASLDRIDSSKGYIKGNIQWIHKDINKLKLDYDEIDIKFICRSITEYQQLLKSK